MPTDYRAYTGQELREARDRLGAGVQEVAAALGKSRTTVWRMERPDHSNKWLQARRYFAALDAIAERHGGTNA